MNEFNFSLNIVQDLFDGIESDLKSEVNLNTKKDLLVYSYQVAGTVGLMMAKILKVKDKQALRCAVDLGVAMQLTNIARDVLEDAKNSRRYIPESWLNLEPLEIAKMNNDKRPMVSEAINRLVKLADVYYESAMTGIYHIPWRS